MNVNLYVHLNVGAKVSNLRAYKFTFKGELEHDFVFKSATFDLTKK